MFGIFAPRSSRRLVDRIVGRILPALGGRGPPLDKNGRGPVAGLKAAVRRAAAESR